ncbi:AAA family ATPase, partial [Vibrio sp. 10N.222.49.A3]|uniref:AAA family ATPase n=1 Tax=Vibrio sp. 10N.222.49.A3 TaxID=3229611 RepID=UPI00354FC9F2
LSCQRGTLSKSVFREQDLYYQIGIQAQYSGDRAKSINALSQRASISDRTIALGVDRKGYLIYSTQEIIQLENELVTIAKVMATTFHTDPCVSDFRSLVSKQKGNTLSEEQRASIECIMNSKAFCILQGSAGTGKSFSMKTIKQVYERHNQTVFGACIAKIAADNLQMETGIKSGTIAKLLADSKAGKHPLRFINVLVIDEAGQVGCKQMHSILKLAKESQTKVILVGEDKQLDAIELGGVLKFLSQPEIIGTSRIQTIRRQNELWARQVVANFRDGNALVALQELSKRSLITIAQSHQLAIMQLVKKWKSYVVSNPHKEAIVLAQKWSDVDSISSQLRAHFKKCGEVEDDLIEIKCSVSGRTMIQAFAVGDRVRFTKNDYKLGVSNGTFGKVMKISIGGEQYNLQIKCNDSTTVTINNQNYTDENGNFPLIHAYAMTVYSSQGITVNGSTFILYNSYMGREATYVAGSRHKDNSYFFFNSKDVDYLSTGKKISTNSRLEEYAKMMNFRSKHKLAIEYLDNHVNEKLIPKNHEIQH